MYWLILIVVLIAIYYYSKKDHYVQFRDLQGNVMDPRINKVGNLVFGGAGGMEKMESRCSSEICAVRGQL